MKYYESSQYETEIKDILGSIDIIKSTVPVLKEHGVEITTTFYKRRRE